MTLLGCTLLAVLSLYLSVKARSDSWRAALLQFFLALGLAVGGVALLLNRTYAEVAPGVILVVSSGTVAVYSRRMARLRRSAHNAATQDSLTQFFNREHFLQILEEKIEAAYSGKTGDARPGFVLLLVEPNRFQTLHDKLGQASGEALLQSMAMRLKVLAKQGCTVGRVGDCQFAFLREETGEGQVEELGKQIFELLKEPFYVKGQQIYLTACSGASLYPRDGKTADYLLNHAYAALNEGKKKALNNFQVYTEANAGDPDDLRLETDLHKALQRNELVLYYQPMLDLHSNKITSLEALIRWRHPRLGLIMPEKFIPLAEANGLIVPIGLWVLEQACRDNQKWQLALGSPLKISVNISCIQFLDPFFYSSLREILDRTGIAPSNIKLEITETSALIHSRQVQELLRSVSQIGVGISLDDFGTGYSTLNILRCLPINEIKLDRSFVQNISTNANDLAIASAMVAMGRKLNLNVVAEGVEHQDQLELLQAQNCNSMQGFLLSPPLPIEELEKKAQEKRMEELASPPTKKQTE